MPGRVAQINTSKGGVPKTPIPIATVGALGIAGDEHRYKDHGGREKALLLMAAETIDALRAEGWPVYYGAPGREPDNARTGPSKLASRTALPGGLGPAGTD